MVTNKYSATYGKNNTKKNGHVATCVLASIIEIIINPIKYLFFLVCRKLSINNITNTNSMYESNCALAAIKSFSKYISRRFVYGSCV